MSNACTYNDNLNIIRKLYPGGLVKEKFVNRIFYEIYVIFMSIFKSKKIISIYNNKFRIIEIDTTL